jgi:hypothetical protein
MIGAMADRDETKAERKQARAKRRKGRPEGKTKAERKRARRAALQAVPEESGRDTSLAERIDSRLANLEEAVAVQSELSEELLEKVDALLSGTSRSGTRVNPPPSDGD